MRGFWLLLAGALLSACASAPAPVSPEAPEASRGSSAGATPAVTAPPAADSRPESAAVDGLLAEARRLRAEGNIQDSLARLDRALRIAPQNAEVYLELARSHRAAGADARASASAERGLLYCAGTMCRQLRGFVDD